MGRRLTAVLALVLAALAASGCGASVGAEGAGERARAAGDPPPAGQVAISGGSAEQRSLLRSILAGMGEIGMEAVEIRRPGEGWSPFPEGAVEVAFTSTSDRGVRRVWEQDLVGGVFRDRSEVLGLPEVVVVSGPGGGVRVGPTAAELVGTLPSPPKASREDADALAERLERAAAAANAQIAELSFPAPYGLAFALTLRVEEPVRFLRSELRPFLDLLWDRDGRYEGGYVRLLDAAGGFVFEAMSSRRVQAAGHRIRPDLEGCNPIPRSRPCCEPPPPCPPD